jgi:peptidoglycan hydrolase-like protein with peptidoglycan-binding domain
VRRNVIRLLGALVAIFVATVIGQTLTPAMSATSPTTSVPPISSPPADEPTTTTTSEPEAAVPTTTTVAPATRRPPVTEAAAEPEPEAQARAEEPADGSLRPGEKGERVLDLQRRLRDLGYWLGTPDGTYGGLTVQAVTAFQKVEGLSRDGIAGASTLSALDQAGRPTARSDGGDLIEVDKAHQVLLVVRDGRV